MITSGCVDHRRSGLRSQPLSVLSPPMTIFSPYEGCSRAAITCYQAVAKKSHINWRCLRIHSHAHAFPNRVRMLWWVCYILSSQTQKVNQSRKYIQGSCWRSDSSAGNGDIRIPNLCDSQSWSGAHTHAPAMAQEKQFQIKLWYSIQGAFLTTRPPNTMIRSRW